MRRVRTILLGLVAGSVAANAVLLLRVGLDDWPWTAVAKLFRAWSRDEAATEVPPVAYRMRGTEVELITPVEADAAEVPLLLDALVIAPGRYRLWSRVYDLAGEGAYRFVNPQTANVQRIAYAGDVDALLSGLAWAVSHGKLDDTLGTDALQAKARTGKLSLTCDRLAALGRDVLSARGVPARVVLGRTAGHRTGYDDGHSVLEVFHPAHHIWAVYDLDNNARFEDAATAAPLSALELSDRLGPGGGDYRIVEIAADTRLDVSGFRSPEGFDWTFVGEGAQADLRSWYARVLQVVLLPADGRYVFPAGPYDEKIRAYNDAFEPMPRARLEAQFYAPPTDDGAPAADEDGPRRDG